jgi:hypothetical protein
MLNQQKARKAEAVTHGRDADCGLGRPGVASAASSASPPSDTGSGEPVIMVPERRVLDAGLFAVGSAYGLAALVGLPLFEDGGWYYFKIVTDADAVVPNLRYAAVLPQLPGVLAARLGADAETVRHAFALGYAALPIVSLTACWVLVRDRVPALMLLPLLSFLLNQVNFSSVSELLSSLYLTWPLVLAMSLRGDRVWVWVFAALAAPLLLFLHPMAFVVAFGLAALALGLAWQRRGIRRIWLSLALLLTVHGIGRLIWTWWGATSYERSNLTGDGLAHYLLTETTGQHLLLAATLVLGLTVTWALFRGDGVGERPCRPPRWAGWVFLLLPVIALLIAAEILAGEGIKLKSAATFGVALLLMALAALTAGYAEQAEDRSVLRRGYASPGALALLAMVILLLAKSAAWWTATHGLKNLIAESQLDCIPHEWEAPFGLQWPWMGLIDDWVTPMNALAFRSELPLPGGGGLTPIPLLLPGDGCRVLRETGLVYPTSWVKRPFEVLDARFGPLRRP